MYCVYSQGFGRELLLTEDFAKAHAVCEKCREIDEDRARILGHGDKPILARVEWRDTLEGGIWTTVTVDEEK